MRWTIRTFELGRTVVQLHRSADPHGNRQLVGLEVYDGGGWRASHGMRRAAVELQAAARSDRVLLTGWLSP